MHAQKDPPPAPTPPTPPWKDDTAIPDVRHPDFYTPKPGEDLNPPSGNPTRH